MMMITKTSTLNMNREEWLEHRRHSIGGSDAATIVGLNPWGSPYELWADKLGKIPPKEETEAMRIGHDLEDYVAKRFTEATGKRVRRENSILQNMQFPFAHANVDRMIIGEKAGLECKTTSMLDLRSFRGGDYPAYYYAQCQHYMMVTGFKTWYLAVLVLGRGFFWYEIKRNEEDINALREAEEDFWCYVVNKKEPPIDDTEACGRTLETLYAESDADIEIDMTTISDILEKRSAICESIKELEKRKKLCENEVKNFMAEAEKGSCEGYRVIWKTQQRSTLDSKRLAADHPEIDLAAYQNITSSRILRITEVKANG